MSSLIVRGGGVRGGAARVPGDKSIGHRAVILAAISDGESVIRGLSAGEDNRRTVAALQALGVAIEARGDGLVVQGRGVSGLRPPPGPLDCGNSGTTMRLLAGLLAGRPFPSVLVGDRYLESRPMARIAGPLAAMGATLLGRKRGPRGELCAPLTVGPLAPGACLFGIDFVSPVASAQVKTALLLAALQAQGATTIVEPMRSRDHAERRLRALGAPISVEQTARGPLVRLDPAGWSRVLPARDCDVPGDLSSAAFLLGAVAISPGSRLRLHGVGTNPTRTGVLDALAALGAEVRIVDARDQGGEPVADLEVTHAELRGAAIEGELALRAIDELPLLAALAGVARGRTAIRDAGELRVKESDRVSAMARALAAFGVAVEERPDGLEIEGRGPEGLRTPVAPIDSHGDHRIAMAVAVLALRAPGTTRIDHAENVATSYPGFAAALASLGADVEERG